MGSNFLRYFDNVEKIAKNKKIKKIKVKFIVYDYTGTIRATDIMLQEGRILTGYNQKCIEMINKISNEPKHYNILARGQNNKILINNNGKIPTGLNLNVKFKNGTSGNFKIETLQKSRFFIFRDLCNMGDEVSIDAFKFETRRNGALTNKYIGSYMSVPQGVGAYNIDMNKRDIGRFVFYIYHYEMKGLI